MPSLGIRVNGKSAVDAQGWVSKIQKCDAVPPYFKKQILSTNIDPKGFIYLSDPQHPERLAEVRPKQIVRTWTNDWAAAFRLGEWELTTGLLEIDVDPGKSTGRIRAHLEPDLDEGEEVDRGLDSDLTRDTKLTETVDDVSQLGEILGYTFPRASLNSHRKLIAVADRVELKMKGALYKSITMQPQDMVNIWFHEIACHAGLYGDGRKPDVYGHTRETKGEASTADEYQDMIDDDIPTTQKLQDIFKDIRTMLNTPAPSKR